MKKDKEKNEQREKGSEKEKRVESCGKKEVKVSPQKEQKTALMEKKAEAPQSVIMELQDKLLRLRADFDNFHKRIVREKVEIYESANSNFMLELLPVLDHLELAIKAAFEHTADKAFTEGLQIIYQQLMSILKKFGLSCIDTEKKPFNPAQCEAINYISSDTVPEGNIIVQTRTGYLFKKKLLRPAQVIVSSGQEKEAKGESKSESKAIKE